MSGFGSGSFGGFGQNNNNNNTQQSTFGGFGSTNNNTNTGFGATNNTATAFGSNTNTGGGLFGNNSNTSGGFGATSSGFGANNTNSAFGAKPAGAFGTTASSSGTGLFGSGNNASTGTTSFGGFGSNNTTANTGTSTGFGATGGGMFGGGTTNNNNTGTGSLFGGGGNTSGTTGFGGFGATNNPGIGGNASDPPGTNTTPFQAYQEKETTGTGNQSNSFQNILFQDPYKKWSAEELRLTDYAQGRRYGNASGTGAFGVSNFGGTGGFGATNNTTQQQSTGFGSTPSAGSNLFGGGGANTTSAFGSGSTGTFGSTNTGGGLFGATNKPAATGGLFGGGAAQPAATGGLFGGSGTASTGFGSNTNTATGGFGSNTATTGGGGLFGSTANNNQAKPGGFSFGNTNTAPTNTGFGAGNTGSAFGSNNPPANTTGGGLFGGGNTGTTGGGLFGGGANNQQQQSASTGFGGGTGFGAQTQQSGGSLFGNTNQQKPAGGLFGGGAATNTGGGLFGNAGGNTTAGFGATNTGAGGGGLFGAQKPATGGTGLFGSAQPAQNTATTGGTGLFGGLGGNTQNQQTGQGGLFGGGAQNQAKPSLFGTSQSAGGGLFGSQNNQQQSSLFNSGQQQQQGSLLGGSLLGNSQNNNAPAQQSLTASISDLSAYGTPALFSNLNGNEMANPGPLATPLSSKTKTRRSSILPMYKLNPASSTRFVTPQKRGFGFSYSTYGSPSGSPSSVTSTPGSMNRSMLGSSLSRGLSKSVSSSSLRKSFTAEDSILAPGAFSASSGPRYYGNTGSVRKLVINKDMRSDLFATPTKEKPALDTINGSRKLSKRVSFDTSTMDASEDGDHDVATPRNAPAISNDLDARSTNGTKAMATSSPADVDPSKGKELAIVHEEDAYAQTPQVATEASDKVPGMYWMSPKQDVISSMNRMQRQKVANFTVGRDNVGYVSFKVPVDLTSIDLDEIFGGIVVLETRSATVYPNAAKKPPVGKGLNVPATISLDQSWPRGRDKRPTIDQKRLNKHIERLKKIPDTTFVDYNSETGVWKFSVEHFTTYGLDYDEDETDADLGSGEQSQQQRAPAVATVAEHSSSSDDLVSPGEDDTFDFRRKRRALPGAFDQREGQLEDDEDDDVLRSTTNQSQPFFGHSSAGSTSKALILMPEDGMAIDQDDEYDMYENEDGTGPSLEQHLAAEQQTDSSDDPGSPIIETPGGILRARMRAIKGSATPLRLQVADGDAWMDMLQKSVSPQKRDRALLKNDAENGNRFSGEKTERSGTASRVVSDGRGFATSIDLMNSLFEKAKAPASKPSPAPMGFVQWPYERQRKTFGDQSDLSENDLAYHKAVKPGWGPDGTLVFPAAPSSLAKTMKPAKGDILSIRARVPQGAETGVCLMKFSNESSAKAIENQMRATSVALVDGVPTVSLNAASLKSIFHHSDLSNPANAHEKLVWDLASILFDRVVPSAAATEEQLRKRQLSGFWTDLVDAATSRAVALAKSSEEKALTSLAGHRVQEACKLLVDGKDFRLATLVALIGTSNQSKRDMRTQLAEWQDNNVLSDFTDAIRAIYEVLSGNVCVCEGKKGVPVADRMESFVIARRFGLDWKQSFGLRLWYAIAREQSVPAAVKKFVDDVAQDREDVPHPWYIEQGFDALWDDQDRHQREDLLWGLLKLHADDATDLESILRPENSQLSPLDSRLTWQLGRALPATGKVSFGVDASEKADAATLSFADQLVNEGNWVEATFVLLHLSNPKTRAKAVQEHLSRHAGSIGSETSADFTTLTQTLKIPSAWVWEARALYMRSVKADPISEVKCLLQAESYEAAHRVLVDKVAPTAVIERDYDGLATLLAFFEGHEESVSGWGLGGEIYRAFLTLHRRFERRERVPSDVVEKLLCGLPVIRETAESGDMISQAAVSEMSSIVAKVVMDATEHDQNGVSRILGLPLTEDAYLQHSLHLGRTYYQGIMAGAR
ncbi:hypothetical protein D7B24_001181 [Verticillium nonalfalfae]|uniref:Peptidase S59 domain-containing protein n=1 Tax=Verticillium nonalfalfae TaxID=1051616 RepID=A0A3M9Y092_9PEZI|nr:uncharacterized protein D7B24_001181 [Verticillium nonalfalfae]RNJ53937.1 hypothetical protein D7B24_001181 [Verticillium nonalfalfae]